MSNNRRQHRPTRRVIAIAGALAVASSALGGLLPLTTGAQSPSTPSGSVTLVMEGEPRSLGAWTGFLTDSYPVLRNVEEALTNRDPVTNDLVPELATSWEQVDDLTWRFQLREGVTFHDGSPFNAEAAASSLNHTWGKDNDFIIRQYIGPEFVATAVDEYTLDVTTETPDPILPVRLYFSPISSAQHLAEHPEEYDTVPVGTGPYRFVEWARGERIVLEANPDWWGIDAEDSYGKATIADATMLFRQEAEVRAAMVSAGEADFARWVTAEQCAAVPTCSEGPGVETLMLRLDTPNPALADLRVRQAIALAIDKDSIMSQIMGGGATAAMIAGPAATGFNPDLEPIPYDPERAAQLIAEAAADGVPVDAPLVVETSAGWIPRSSEAIQIIADSLRSIGLTNVTTLELETARSEEMFVVPLDQIPPERGLLAYWSHGNELMDYSASLSGYYTCSSTVSTFCDPEVDAQIQAASELSGDARDAALQELAATVLEPLPIVPIGYPNVRFGLSDRLDWTSRLDGFILLKEMTLAE